MIDVGGEPSDTVMVPVPMARTHSANVPRTMRPLTTHRRWLAQLNGLPEELIGVLRADHTRGHGASSSQCWFSVFSNKGQVPLLVRADAHAHALACVVTCAQLLNAVAATQTLNPATARC